MPRLVRSVPKYRRHRASGQAVVPLNGRDHDLGPHGTRTSQIEYDRLIGEWLAAGRHPAGVSRSEVTVAELCVRYWKWAKAYHRAHDAKNRNLPSLKQGIRYLSERYSRILASEFGPLALKSVREQMIENDLSRRYVNDLVARIKRIFKWTVGEQLIHTETLQALLAIEGLRNGRSSARECGPGLPVDDAVVEATLPHLPDVLADMVRLQRLTGMRPAEQYMTRPCDIDRTTTPWKYTPRHHKTAHCGRDRMIFLGPRVQAILLQYLNRHPELHCFRPKDSRAKRRAKPHATCLTPLSCGSSPRVE